MRSGFPLFATGGLLLALAAASYFVGATYGAGAPVPPPVRSDEVAEKDRKHLRIVDDYKCEREVFPGAQLQERPGELLDPLE